jgi:hypothetical protein
MMTLSIIFGQGSVSAHDRHKTRIAGVLETRAAFDFGDIPHPNDAPTDYFHDRETSHRRMLAQHISDKGQILTIASIRAHIVLRRSAFTQTLKIRYFAASALILSSKFAL